MTKEPFIVINPQANSGRLGKNIDKILKTTKEYLGNFEYVLTDKPRHEVELAEKAIKEGYRTIVALGGDGTATNMGDVAVRYPEVTLGLLSAGSMCDWHRTHAIPHDLENSLEIFIEGHVEKFPAMKCDGDLSYYAFDVADGGFTGRAAAAAHYEMKWMKIGLIKYNFLAFKYVLKFKNTPCRVTIDDRESILVEALTNVMAGVGDILADFVVLPSNAYYSRKNKDLGMVVAHDMKGARRIQMLVRSGRGKLPGMKGIWFTRGNKVVVESIEDPLCWTAEGEVFNENNFKVEVERIDDALSLVVPKERDYPLVYDESIYHETFEESFEERKIDPIKS
jgi:diacylglycerol kinase (ATP)